MAWTINTAQIGMQPIETISTVQKHPLGKIVQASDPTYGGAEFIYLLGVASTVAGSWVTYDDLDGATALLAASKVGPVAIAMGANVASSYGWYMITGKHSAAQAWASLSLATGAVLYATATAGLVDDAVVSGDRIYRATVDVAKVSAVATVAVTINRPEITNEDPTA
jgi:hypothetical protein